MTRVNLAAMQNAAKRIALLVLGGMIAINVTACGESTQMAGSELTQPLAPAQPATPPIAFAPIIGAPADVSVKLTEKLNGAAKEKNINVVANADAEYRVLGYLVAVPDKKGTKLSYTWDITDKAGKRAKRIQGEEPVSPTKTGDLWTLISDEALQKVAASTATQIYDWLSKPKDAPAAGTPVAAARPAQGTPSSAAMTPAAARPAASAVVPVASTAAVPKGDPNVIVPPVTGAPGDGQTSLAAAMRKHLASQGVKVTEAKGANTYSVRGMVEMGPAEGGQQPITIRWLVVDPAGKQLSNAVVQRNKVDQGSLDNAWGQVADIAAGAAAAEVVKIVPKPTS